MKQTIKKATESVLVRYLAVGGTSYAVELSCLLALYHLAHVSRTKATAIAYWVGLGMAFVLQKLIAFKNYQREVKALTRQGLLYGLLQAWDYLFTVGFVGLTHGNVIIMRTVAQVLFSCWNYVLYKKVIFKQQADLAV